MEVLNILKKSLKFKILGRILFVFFSLVPNFVFSLNAKIIFYNQKPTLFIDEHPYSPLIYCSREGPTEKSLYTIEIAKKHGINLISWCDITIPLTRPNEEPNYKPIDSKIEKVLQRNPNAMLILRISVFTPDWWLENHPNSVMLYKKLEDGKFVETTEIKVTNKKMPSVACEEWKKSVKNSLRSLILHLEEKFGDNIIGYHPSFQNTNEWFYYDAWEKKLNCYEPVFENAFRNWVKEKYKKEEILKEIWGDQNITFNTITLPTPEERMFASKGFFRDPKKEQKTIDFHEFQNEIMASTLEEFAKVIKEATRNKKIVVSFYGYIFELSGIPYGIQQSGHLAFKKLLNSPYLDVFVAPVSYLERGLGGIGGFMSAVDSLPLHNKLFLNEDDHITHLYNKEIERENKLHFYLGGTNSLEETQWIHIRNFAHIFPRKMGCWWFDLFGTGWLNDEGIWENLGKLKNIYDSHLLSETSFLPEIAVIVDEKSNFYIRQNPPQITEPLLRGIRSHIFRIGTPVGFYYLDDLTNNLIPRAKLYIFLNCFALTNSEREAIKRNCKGSTCIFFYANGIIKNTSIDVKNLEEIYEVKMKEDSNSVQGQIKVLSNDSLTENLEDFGVNIYLSPVFYPLENVNVIGVYQSNNLPAVWYHTGKSYKIYYIGTLTATSSLLRNIAKDAKVHIFTETDDVVEANEKFIGIIATKEGEKIVKLKKDSTVLDAFSGNLICEKSNYFKVKMKKGEARLFFLK